MKDIDRILAAYAALVACEGIQSMPQSWIAAMDTLVSLMEDYDSKIHHVGEEVIRNAVSELAKHPEAYGCA
jgi:hypothetical protein